MTGRLTLSSDPTTNYHAATKQYVDAVGLASGAIPTGTTMLFAQASAPSGWTKISTYDNAMIRVVSGSGGGSGGSDDPTIMNKIPAHTHIASTNTTGHHTHTGVGWNGGFVAPNTYPGFDGTGDSVAQTTSHGAGNHSHTVTVNQNTGSANWTPKYYNVIFARKN